MAAKILMPKNCTSCERTRACKTHYGGLGCAYKEEIKKAILEAERKRNEKN